MHGAPWGRLAVLAITIALAGAGALSCRGGVDGPDVPPGLRAGIDYVTPTRTAIPTAAATPVLSVIAFPTATMAPTIPAPPRQVSGASSGKLSEPEMRAVLAAAGWPEGLHHEALQIAWCESRWGPGSLNSIGRAGLFQLAWSTWFREALRRGYVHEGQRALWHDPVVNARVALATYEYLGRWGSSGGWSCAAIMGLH